MVKCRSYRAQLQHTTCRACYCEYPSLSPLKILAASNVPILTLFATIGCTEGVAALLEAAISGGGGIVAAASVMQQKDFFLLFNQQDPDGLSADVLKMTSKCRGFAVRQKFCDDIENSKLLTPQAGHAGFDPPNNMHWHFCDAL